MLRNGAQLKHCGEKFALRRVGGCPRVYVVPEIGVEPI